MLKASTEPITVPAVTTEMMTESLERAKRQAIDSAAFSDIARVATLGAGAGVGLRGLYGLLQTLGRASSEPAASIPAPVTLDIPVAKKKEESRRRAGMKFSQDKSALGLPDFSGLLERGLQNASKYLSDTAKRVSKGVGEAARGDHADSPVGRSYYIPAMIGAGVGSGAAGYKLTDWLLDDIRKGNTEDELEQAKKEYEDALYGKTAEAVDALHDAVIATQDKRAGMNDIPGAATGAYLTYAIGAPLLIGKMVYDQDKKYQRKRLIDAAQNMRRRMRQEASPPPVYINPVMPDDEEKTAKARSKKKKKDKPDNSAWLGYGLGGAGLGALGTAYGLASDQQAKDVQDAVQAYNPTAFTAPNAIPDTTGMTHYHNTLAPGAALAPFGVPVRDLLIKARSNKRLMDLMGIGEYHLATPIKQNGLSGRAHYTMFGNGAIPAYVHQLKGRGGAFANADQIVPENLAGKPGVTYADWMNSKLEKFLEGRLGERLNPFEVTTQLLPQKDQAELMRKFYASGTPEEQAYRSKMELPGEGYHTQSKRYLGPAKAFITGRNALKTTGITALGAGAGALGGNWLYNKIRGKKRRSELKQFLSSVAGAGLGGTGAFLAGTDAGRGLVNSGLDKIRQNVQQLIPPGEFKAAAFNSPYVNDWINRISDSVSPETKADLLWTLLAGAGGATAGALYSPRHSPTRGAIMGGLAGLGAGAGLTTGNKFMDSLSARNLQGTLYGQAPVILGTTGLGGAAGLRAGRALADALGAKGRKEKGDADLSEVDVLSNPDLRERVLA